MEPDEDTQRWMRLLAIPAKAEPEPEPEPDVAAMTTVEYSTQRLALGVTTASDIPGSTNWADRRASTIAAQHAASPRQPDEEMAAYVAERERLGIRDVSDVAGEDRTPGPRRWVSPWRIT